jgi:hypothetical protein
MNKKNEINKELEEVAPFLVELKKEKSGFQVPDNYFKEMQNQVILQLNESPEVNATPTLLLKFQQNSIRTIQLLAQPRYALRAAGFALVVAVAGIFYFQFAEGNAKTEFLAGITAEDMSDYVNEHIDDFDLEEFLDVAEVEARDLYSIPDTKNEELDNYIDEIIDDFDIEELEEML